MGNMRWRGVAKPAYRGDFRPRRRIARTGDHAGIDGIADDHIEPHLGGRGTTPGAVFHDRCRCASMRGISV